MKKKLRELEKEVFHRVIHRVIHKLTVVSTGFWHYSTSYPQRFCGIVCKRDKPPLSFEETSVTLDPLGASAR